MVPLYRKILEDLRARIQDGTYTAGQQVPTESELSRVYGVSRITSKRALEELSREGKVIRIKGKGTFVQRQKEEIVPPSKPVQHEHKNAVALIFPYNVAIGTFSPAVDGASDLLKRHGISTHVYTGLEDVTSVEDLICSLFEDGTSGIIYYPFSEVKSYELMNRLIFNEYPLVTIDKYFSGIPVDYVSSDNRSGGILATEYLIGLGHKNIGFVSDIAIEKASSVRERYLGYCQALKKAGLAYNTNLVKLEIAGQEFRRIYQEEIYRNVLKELVAEGVTAIFAINDFIASYLIRVAIVMGIAIPNQISIIGFDDMAISAHQQIPITTISQDFYHIGSKAAQIIMNKILDPHSEGESVTIPVTLVERDSCCPLHE